MFEIKLLRLTWTRTEWDTWENHGRNFLTRVPMTQPRHLADSYSVSTQFETRPGYRLCDSGFAWFYSFFFRRYVKTRNTYRTLLKKLCRKKEIYAGKRKIKNRSGPEGESLFLEVSVNCPLCHSEVSRIIFKLGHEHFVSHYFHSLIIILLDAV